MSQATPSLDFILGRARELASPKVGWSFRGLVGLGDQVYMRPFVLDAVLQGLQTFLYTPWPELYWHVEGQLGLIPEHHGFRTQQANVEAQPPGRWTSPPRYSRFIDLNYTPWTHRQEGTIIDAMLSRWGVGEIDFSLPVAPAWEDSAQRVLDGLDLGGRQLCLVYLPTVRHEWYVPARNPKPEYLRMLLEKHRERFFYLGVSWVAEGQEMIDGDYPVIDAQFIHGELHYTVLAALARQASMVLTHPNFMVPLGAAVGARMFVLYGGFTRPSLTLDPRMGLETVRYVAPEPFCHCVEGSHNCVKDIPLDRLDWTFERFLAEVVESG